MKTAMKFPYSGIMIILTFIGGLLASENNESVSLAVVVHYESESKDLADSLQPLLEAEVSLQWPGRMVERAELDKLLGELKISKSGLSDPNNQLQLGKLIHIDCLLTVRVNKDSVKTIVTLFPSTMVIHEKVFRERLEPQSLAINIATDAIRAIREHNRDPNIPHVSIGSFYGVGLSKQYFNFGRDICTELRKELVEDKTITLTERLLPSDLLSEFELARAGITESIARNLSAPPSDILLYGEFKTKSEQDLTKPAAELDFTLFVVSPTGLYETRRIEFSCYSNEPKAIIKKALELIKQSTDKVRTKLSSGQKRIFSEKEFEEFKKQAFQLMRNPPPYNGSFATKEFATGMDQQIDNTENLENVLHMFECAMLFKGNDTQILICAGAVLEGMAEDRTDIFSTSQEDMFRKKGLEFIERAYLLDSNWNTRQAYFHFFVYRDGSSEILPFSIDAAQHIWDTRKIEAWKRTQLHFVVERLLQAAPDFKDSGQIFIDYVEENGDLMWSFIVFDTIITRVYESEGDLETTQQSLNVAKQMIRTDSLFLRSLGHRLYLVIYDNINRNKEESSIPVEFASQFRALINIFSDLYEVYGEQVSQWPYTYRLYRFFDIYEQVIQQYNLQNDSADLMETYISVKMKMNYDGEDGTPQILNKLLTKMWEAGKYQDGYKLLVEYMEKHKGVGGSEAGETRSLRQLNRFYFAMQNRSPIKLSQLQKIESDDNRTGEVLKFVVMENNIYGIRGTASSAKFFRLVPSETKADIFEQVSGGVYDIALSGRHIGVATESNGFYLIDIDSSKIQNFTHNNSSFPSNKIEYVYSHNGSFIIGIESDDNPSGYIYSIDPKTYQMKQLDRKTDITPETSQRIYSHKNSKQIYGQQYVNPIIKEVNGQTLEWSKMPSPLRSSAKKGIKQIVVTTHREVKTTTLQMQQSNHIDNALLFYQGIELSYVNDFTLWKDWLVFATGNGLYVSKPYSNEIHCLVSDLDLLFFSLCPLEEQMYIGTSNGLYCIEDKQFLDIVNDIE